MIDTKEARKLYLASGNAGKLKEFRVLAEACGRNWQLELLPDFSKLPEFEESAPTFAENAAGKAFYYSRHVDGIVFADDSGLVGREPKRVFRLRDCSSSGWPRAGRRFGKGGRGNSGSSARF